MKGQERSGKDRFQATILQVAVILTDGLQVLVLVPIRSICQAKPSQAKPSQVKPSSLARTYTARVAPSSDNSPNQVSLPPPGGNQSIHP